MSEPTAETPQTSETSQHDEYWSEAATAERVAQGAAHPLEVEAATSITVPEGMQVPTAEAQEPGAPVVDEVAQAIARQKILDSQAALAEASALAVAAAQNPNDPGTSEK